MLRPDPEMLMKSRQYGEHVTAEIEFSPEEGTFSVKFLPKDEMGKKMAKQLASEFPQGLAQQFKMMFNMDGKLKRKKV